MNVFAALSRLTDALSRTANAYFAHAERVESLNAEFDARLGSPSAATLAADELGDDGQANGQPQLPSPRRKR